MEQDNTFNNNAGFPQNSGSELSDGTKIIPVIEEFLTVGKETVETGKVYISKRSTEKDAEVNIPLMKEGYTVERKTVKSKILDKAPGIRHEGDTMIIPVLQEVLVIEKKFEVIEEVHVIKTQTEVPHIQQIPLMKEEVIVERVALNQNKDQGNF
ncbi:MAG: hypothetical protein JWP88_1267 [Flaviaesturariibacter sp.]|nr:hypothetical protein [Flaviaesturariibacter sp.]